MANSLMTRRSACTSDEWIRYFEDHAGDLAELPWSGMTRLTPDERRKVLPSIAIFQLGESGEGRHLFRAAQRWAEASGDHAYVTALKLFIEEEHRHADMLGRYLDLAGHPRLEQNWTDGVFRRLRHLAGLELSITVLLSAELVAMVYYAALRRATGCPLLAAISRQVLEDECAHIRFQAQQIGRMRAARPAWLAGCAEWLHAGLLAAISVIVWGTHGPVFRAAGLSYFKFVEKLWGQFRAASAIMRSMRTTREHEPRQIVLCPT